MSDSCQRHLQAGLQKLVQFGDLDFRLFGRLQEPTRTAFQTVAAVWPVCLMEELASASLRRPAISELWTQTLKLQTRSNKVEEGKNPIYFQVQIAQITSAIADIYGLIEPICSTFF